MSLPPAAAVSSMVTDCHVHLVPPSLTAARGDDAWRPSVTFDGSRQLSVSLRGRPMPAVVAELSRVEVVLAEAAVTGVERLLLSPWVATLPVEEPAAAAAAVCRLHNEAMAATVAADRDHLAGLGAVPLQDPGLAARELEAVLASGLSGVEVTASAAGVYLGDDRLEPFWAAAEARGALVFVHPTTRGFGLPVFGEYYLWNAVANPMETAITAAHLVMAGVLERHPGLRILLAHGGGALPAVVGRLGRAWATRPEARARLAEPPDRSWRRLHFDTVTHDPALLAHLVAFAGADHVLLGSDRPFDMGTERPVEAVRQLGLPPEAEALILWGNAERLLAPAGAGR